MLDYNQLHEIYRNTTLYISSIPAGAGGSFLGYLQNYYRDAVPQLTPVEYPTDNFWDSVGGVPCVIQYSDKDTFNDIPLEETYVNEDFQAEGEENSAKILASLNTLHTEIQGNNGPNPDNTVYIHAHVFPNEYNFNLIFKQVHCLFRVEADYNTLLYCGKLKFNKPRGEWLDDNMDNLVHKVSTIYRQQQRGQLVYPALNSINYNKFFFDIDRDEIQKYFTFIEKDEYSQQRFDEKFDTIAQMTREYTAVNRELINE